MCKAVMSGDPGEDPQVHACKLLEVVILQCHGKIDSVSEIVVDQPSSEDVAMFATVNFFHWRILRCTLTKPNPFNPKPNSY